MFCGFDSRPRHHVIHVQLAARPAPDRSARARCAGCMTNEVLFMLRSFIFGFLGFVLARIINMLIDSIIEYFKNK